MAAALAESAPVLELKPVVETYQKFELVWEYRKHCSITDKIRVINIHII